MLSHDLTQYFFNAFVCYVEKYNKLILINFKSLRPIFSFFSDKWE